MDAEPWFENQHCKFTQTHRFTLVHYNTLLQRGSGKIPM